MSHFCVEVHVPIKQKVDYDIVFDKANEIMNAFCDDGSGGEDNDNSICDWYQIGGRWTGYLSKGKYNPEKDPKNLEPCDHCAAKRMIGPTAVVAATPTTITVQARQCPTCNGLGKRPKWPTEWRPYPGDAVPVSKVPKRAKVYAYIINGKYIEDEQHTIGQVLRQHKVKSGYLVTVDCHI